MNKYHYNLLSLFFLMHIFITYIILENAFLKHIYNMKIYISKIIWKHNFKQLKNIPLINTSFMQPIFQEFTFRLFLNFQLL